MKLTILGCHSATPRWDAHPTSQLLEVSGHLFLIDCGEGTQVQLRRYKIKFARIKHIFISHLHGDHFFGLVGLVSTFRLLGREADLHIYGPKGIKEAITMQLKLGKSWTNYGLYFHELDNSESEIVFEDEVVSVRTVPLNHRVYTNGFLIKEKVTERPLNIQACREHHIDKSYFNKIKRGGDVVGADGVLIKNALLTKEPEAPKSYAFCSDTMYHPSVVPIIKGATMLYHEATFLESHKEVAVRTKHSTAKEAAAIAKEAEVGGLIVGHYSGRYGDHEMFKTEAQELFENVILGKDGLEISF
jgi:ribonuclease Z